MPKRGDSRPPIERAMEKVEKDASGCWLWVGSVSGRYGLIYVGVHGAPRCQVAHRAVYEALVGPIASGMTLDHLCRNTLCVNPEHLEPVTHGENVRRGLNSALKTHCRNGHPYPENAIVTSGVRRCGICRREQLQAGQRRYREKKNARAREKYAAAKRADPRT